MEENPIEERRKHERRKGLERRKGEMHEIYKRLVMRKAVLDARKADRRQGMGRSGLPYPTIEEKYLIYKIGMIKKNLERLKQKLDPIPIMSYEKWLKSL